jgi:hypothetical protein
VVEESYFAMKRGSPQIRGAARCDCKFLGSGGQECSGVAAIQDR